MIVCLCTGATDRDVDAAIDEGARCLCDLSSRGIGTSCGSCHESVRMMMAARAVALRELCFEEAILSRIAGRRLDQPATGKSCPASAITLPPELAVVLEPR